MEFSNMSTNSSIQDDIDLAIEWTFEDEYIPPEILLLLKNSISLNPYLLK